MSEMAAYFTDPQRDDLVDRRMAEWYDSAEYKELVARQLAERNALHPEAIRFGGELAAGETFGLR